MYENGFGILGTLGVFAILLLIIPLVLYVINAIALMKIAEGRGNDKGWLAWIPIASAFVIPMLVENDVNESLKGKFTAIFGVSLALVIVPFIGILSSIALGIFTLYAFYVLVKQYTDNAVAYLVITILTSGAAMPVLLFRIRNREPGY